jgi:replicative DNA helicase
MMTEQELKTPRAIEAEQAILGAVLIDPELINQITLTGDMFYSEAHKVIYTNMRALGSDHLDLITLQEVLERKGKLTSVGGQVYLVELVRNTPATHNWEAWQKIITDTHKRRRIIEIAGALATAAFNEELDINQEIAKAATDLVTSAAPSRGTVHISEYLKILYEKVEERANDPKEIYGLPTGIRDFDKITSGMQKRETVILSGPPGTGKSILGFQIAYGMAYHGHAGCVYELEMSGEAILRRKLSALSRITTYAMRSGVGINDQWDQFVKAIEGAADLPIYMSDYSNFDPIQIRADLARQKAKNNIEWFLIDYMDLIKAEGKDSNERSAYISKQLHGIAKDLDLAGLIIHSMNKAGYQSAGMQNLSGSAKVSYDADQIIFIEEENDDKGLIKNVTLTWGKMREGVKNRIMKMIMTGVIPEFNQVAMDEDPEPIDYTV